jgi:LCP family protein required for cell wall assembly
MAFREDAPDKAFPGMKEVNILIMGRDEDRDNHDRVIHNSKGRSDAMMLAHIDFQCHKASILSIPRDTLVRIPGYRGRRRINSANELGGPDLAASTVQRLLGVAPDYYMLLDFKGFSKAIDAVDGIEMNVDKQLDYDDNWGHLHIHLRPGFQKLNGDNAIGFVRFRHRNGGGGDSDMVRISRQQELLSAMRSKLTNPRILMRIPGILDGIRDNMVSNMAPAQMMCLAKFMRSLPCGTNVEMSTVPDTHESRIYVKADAEATHELVGHMFGVKQE